VLVGAARRRPVAGGAKNDTAPPESSRAGR